MSRTYNGSKHRAKLAHDAKRGPHRASQNVDILAPVLNPGDRVLIKKTGVETTILRHEPYGFVLEDHGGWFPAKALSKLP